MAQQKQNVIKLTEDEFNAKKKIFSFFKLFESKVFKRRYIIGEADIRLLGSGSFGLSFYFT